MKIEQFVTRLFGENIYVLYDPASREAAVIDPGMMEPEEVRAVDAFIEGEGLHLTAVLNTHLHVDHCIGDNHLARKYSAPIMASEADAPLGRNLDAQARMFHLPLGPVEALDAYRPLRDGDTVTVGPVSLEVIAVPGHSPGGLALYDAADGIVFTGDSLFAGSIGRTDLAGGDHAALLDAVKRRLLTLPSETRVLPGHGPSTTIARERATNPFLR